MRPAFPPLRSPWLAAAAVVGVALLAYHNSFSGALVLDDITTLTNNASIRHLWPPGNVLSPPNDAGVGGRPVANLSFALSYAIGGLAPAAHHAFNLALHALAGLALFGLVRRTLLTPKLRARFGAAATPLAGASAALWVAHPLATASVDYLSQRTEVLMALFYLLTLYGFVRWSERERRTDAWAAVALAACALGMASKEVMVTAPLMALLYDRTFLSDSWRDVVRRHGWLHAGLATTWALLAALMIASRLADRGVGFAQGVSPLDYALTECSAVRHYLKLALWPQPLVFDHGWAFVEGFGNAWPSVLACVALVVVVLVTWRRRPTLGFAGVWFLLVLAPTSSVYPIVQQPIAESRAYLPLAGVIALGVVALFAAFGRGAWPIAAAATIACTLATMQRNTDYRSAIALLADTVAKQPDNARAHCNLGVALDDAGREAEAIPHFEAALRLRPHYPEAHNNYAAWLIRQERAAEAVPHLEAALQVDPRNVEARYNLGLADMQLGRRMDAIATFEAALALRPDDARIHNNLGVVFLELNRVADALRHDEAAVRLAPDLAVAHDNLANALQASGKFADAIAEYRVALRLDPTFAKAEHNLAVALLHSGDPRGAIEHFEAALRLRPDYAEAQRNLALVRAQLP